MTDAGTDHGVHLQALLFAEQAGGLEQDNRSEIVGVSPVLAVDRGATATWPLHVYLHVWARAGHHSFHLRWTHHGRLLTDRTIEVEHAPSIPKPMEIVVPFANGLPIEGQGEYVMEVFAGDRLVGRGLMVVGHRERVSVIPTPPTGTFEAIDVEKRPHPARDDLGVQPEVVEPAATERERRPHLQALLLVESAGLKPDNNLTALVGVLTSLLYPPGTSALPPLTVYFLIWNVKGKSVLRLEWKLRGKVLHAFEAEGDVMEAGAVAQSIGLNGLPLEGSGRYVMQLLVNGTPLGEAFMDVDLSDPSRPAARTSPRPDPKLN